MEQACIRAGITALKHGINPSYTWNRLASGLGSQHYKHDINPSYIDMEQACIRAEITGVQ